MAMIAGGLTLTCTNDECKYMWIYNGRGRWYATCPQCHKCIRIREMITKQTTENVKE